MQKLSLFLVLVLSSLSIFSQTPLLSDGFESGKGSWVFSTASGGNDFYVKYGYGYNSNNAVRCGSIGNPNFLISPAVNFLTNKPYKLTFMAYSGRKDSRKIEVYYNSSAALNGSETLIGIIDEVPENYTKFTFNLNNPPSGVHYIIFRGVIKANKWTDLVFDDVLLVETANFVPTINIAQPLEASSHTAGKPLTLNVDASDSDGTVSKVQLFYQGELYATLNTAPYTFNIPNLPIGKSVFYARAFDNAGDSTTTPVRTITGVNTVPSCALTVSKTAIAQAENVLFTATPSDTDGEIVSVSFYANDEKVGTVNSAPYEYNWSNKRAGNFNVFAVATDNTSLNGFSDTLIIESTPTTTGVILYENFESGLTEWKVSTSAGGNDWQLWGGGYNATASVHRNNTKSNFLVHANSYFYAAANYQVEIMAKTKRVNTYYLQAGLIIGTDTVWSSNSNVVGLTHSNHQLTIAVPTAGYRQLIVRAIKAGTTTSEEIWVDDIVVKGPGGESNLPPVLKFLSPAKSSELALNTPVVVSVSAYDLMGTVSKVDFYIESELIGTVTTEPYTINWTPTYSGAFNLKAVCTDNNGAETVAAISTFVNFADRKVYDYVVTSYLGGEAGSGKVRGVKVLSDGVIVLACDWGTVIPEGAVLHLLNGATIDSRGTIVRISADGKKILSLTKISNHAVDLAIDNADNIFVAASNRGVVKLNRLADKLLYVKDFAKNVYRVDAGKTGYSIVLTRTGTDFDDKKWDNVNTFVLDPQFNIISSFGGASQYTNDVCIDEATQSAVVVGWRNTKTNARDNTDWLPVDIPGFRVFSFAGSLKFQGYNWSNDPTSPDWLNRAENNMADTRISRVSMGDDGLMYFLAEVSGGNHPLRYSPYDNIKKVRFVGGDNYHVLTNVGTEFHTFVGRMNLSTGNYIEGQSFTARLSSGAGNTLEAEHGNVQADTDGRVYFTGSSASGLPLSRDLLPDENYTGGAFIYVMNPTLQTRELVDRVALRDNVYDVGVRKFANHDKTIVYGGSVLFTAIGKENQSRIFLTNPLQNTFFGTPNEQSGFFAVIGGTTPAQYELKVNGVSKGWFTEGTKVTLSAADYQLETGFAYWKNGEAYIADSTLANTSISMPGKSISIEGIQLNTNTNIVTPNENLKLFPNPARDLLHIATGTNTTSHIEIIDMLGKVIWQGNVAGTTTINTSHFRKGAYIVSVNKTLKHKLLIH